MEIMLPAVIYTALISVISAVLIVSDKIKAKKKKWRIKESVLLLFAILGGSSAMYIAMYLFRHKTQTPKFVYGIPLIFAIQSVLVFYLLSTCGNILIPFG